MARAVWFLAIVVTFLTLGIPFPGPLQVAAIFAAVGAAVVSGGASFD